MCCGSDGACGAVSDLPHLTGMAAVPWMRLPYRLDDRSRLAAHRVKSRAQLGSARAKSVAACRHLALDIHDLLPSVLLFVLCRALLGGEVCDSSVSPTASVDSLRA